jgi:hypothetical protein
MCSGTTNDINLPEKNEEMVVNYKYKAILGME